MEWILSHLWESGGVAIAIIFLLHRIIDNEKLYKWGCSAADYLYDRMKIIPGRKKLCQEFMNTFGALFRGFMYQLGKRVKEEADNKKTTDGKAKEKLNNNE